MKNFTKQITNKTLFKPTRWILLALMLLLGTSGAWAYNQSAVDLYFDNSEAQWATCRVYIGHNNWLAFYNMSRVSGTEHLWKLSSNFNSGNSWNDATHWGFTSEYWDAKKQSVIKIVYTGDKKFTYDNTNTVDENAWTNDKIYKTNGTANVTLDGQTKTAYKITSSTKSNYTVTINSAEGGTLTVKDYDNNTISNGDSKIKLTVLKFSASASDGYDLDKIEIKNSNGDVLKTITDLSTTYTLTSNVTIVPTWVCENTGIQLIGDESQLNLDDVEVGQSKTVQIEFEYCGISGIVPQFPNPQTGFSGSGSLDSNNRTITYNITFAPTEAGVKTATIYIAYANGGVYQQQITANGIVACEPTATLKSASYNATTKKIDLSGSMDPCNQELYYGFLWRVKGDEWNTNDYISGNGGNNNKSDAPLNFTQSWGGFTDGTTYEFTAYALDATTTTWYYNEEGIEVSTCIDVQTPSVTASATEVCQGGEVTLTLKNQQDDVTYTVNGTEAFTDANEFTATNLQSDITYTIAASSTTACTNDPKQTEVNITVLKPSFSGAYIGFIVPVGSNAASYTACDDVTLQTWIQGATQYIIYENDVEIETGDATGKTTGSNPITYTITGKSAGTYVYKVVYKDACDNTSTTGTITLTVPATIDAPKYTLTEPTKCGNSETPGSLAITQQVDGISYTIDDIVTNNLTLEAADHIQPQTYIIKATKTTGSCTRTETTEVTVQTINNTPVVNDIAITTANTTVCAESELTLQLVGDAQDGVSFQWYKDEDAIVGATSSSLTIQNVTASDAGAYKLVVSKTTPCTVTKESNTKTISVDAKSKIEVSAAESFCLGTPVNLASKVTDATGDVTWYTDNTGTQVVNNTNITVSGDITYYAKAKNGVCPATEAVSYTITAKGVTIISQNPATVHPYEVTTFTASGNASWQISTNPSEGAALDNNDPVFSGKTTAYITKADDTYTTFKGEAATGYVIKATADDCETTHTFNVEDDPDNCE